MRHIVASPADVAPRVGPSTDPCRTTGCSYSGFGRAAVGAEGEVQVQFEVMRVCAEGRKQPKHVRIGGKTVGLLSVQQEADEVRRRTALVARILPAPKQRVIPPLFDVVLLSIWGDMWVMAGFERFVAEGDLQERSFAQTWHLAPRETQELVTLDHRWALAVEEARQLRLRLQHVAPGQAAEVPVPRYGLPDGR